MKFSYLVIGIGLLLLIPQKGTSQTILLKQEPQSQKDGWTKANRIGATRRWTSWTSVDVYGAGIPLTRTSARYADMVGLSWTLKHQLSPTWSHGLGISIRYEGYRLNAQMARNIDAATQVLPSSNVTEWEKARYNQMDLEAKYFIRFNFDKNRGNKIGDCLDLGVIAGFVPSEHTQFYHRSEGAKIKETRKNLNISQRGYVDVEVRYTHNMLSVFARYRAWCRTESQHAQSLLNLSTLFVGVAFNMYY